MTPHKDFSMSFSSVPIFLPRQIAGRRSNADGAIPASLDFFIYFQISFERREPDGGS